VKVTVPVKIDSGLNMRVHWRVRANTNASHRAAAYNALKSEYGTASLSLLADLLPCTVTITRVAPRELDDDNMVGGASRCGTVWPTGWASTTETSASSGCTRNGGASRRNTRPRWR
jgi:hypothetical protein